MCTCPACGAGVAEGARLCNYCGAPVATVRCARCFHMNAYEALHCSGCGQELGLEPVGDFGSLSCPRCELAFQAFGPERGTLYDCGKCGGQFIEHSLLRDLLERREKYGLAAPRPPAKNEGPGEVRYLACPVCRVMMNRKNFAGSSGVIVDVCVKHGVWLDAGELPQVLAFVESGGLARAALRGEAVPASARGVRYSSGEAEVRVPVASFGEMRSVDDVADSATRLLESVLQALVASGRRM